MSFPIHTKKQLSCIERNMYDNNYKMILQNVIIDPSVYTLQNIFRYYLPQHGFHSFFDIYFTIGIPIFGRSPRILR